jgi:preprotein translocase SecA subunit
MLNILHKALRFGEGKKLRMLQEKVATVNALEEKISALSDSELRAKTAEFKLKIDDYSEEFKEELDKLQEDFQMATPDGRKDIRGKIREVRNKILEPILPEAFAVVREVANRTLGMRHFDVQIMGGIVLHEGKIAEMKTGEGKTLVATLPAYLNALMGEAVHIVTVNDYLAKRDSEWMGPVFNFLGLTVGLIQANMEPAFRKVAYRADITYGTNNEFGFDYLRDNMITDIDEQVQRGHFYAIIDEVDSILIDEARTPLIISGPSEKAPDVYRTFANIVPRLKSRCVTEKEEEEAKKTGTDLSEGYDYLIYEKNRTIATTEQGIERVEKLLGIPNLYDNVNSQYVNHLVQAVKAHSLFKKDVDYIIKDGEVIIVDEFTGHLMIGRRYSEGLHQAIEAKEKVPIREENQTLATITLQNYFRMYDKIAGMTGTAATEADEFRHIYDLETVSIPTNVPMIRTDEPDEIYKNEKGKFDAIVEDIIERNKEGQPVLVGTISVEKSERLAKMLRNRGLRPQVLNAKHHEEEARIIAQAGRKVAVTIATNMAGRGIDILLGGNPYGIVKTSLEGAVRVQTLREANVLFELIDDVSRRLQHWIEALKTPNFEDILDRGILREDVYKQEVEPLISSLDEIKKQFIRLCDDFEKEGILNVKEMEKIKDSDSDLKPAIEQLALIQSNIGELKSFFTNISGKSLLREDLEKADKIGKSLKEKQQEIIEVHNRFKQFFEAEEIFSEEDVASANTMVKEISERQKEIFDLKKEARRVLSERDISGAFKLAGEISELEKKTLVMKKEIDDFLEGRKSREEDNETATKRQIAIRELLADIEELWETPIRIFETASDISKEKENYDIDFEELSSMSKETKNLATEIEDLQKEAKRIIGEDRHKVGSLEKQLGKALPKIEKLREAFQAENTLAKELFENEVVQKISPNFLSQRLKDVMNQIASSCNMENICKEEREEVLKLGGLHVLGTERHEARRIDNQLRGRSGRQGDPGSSQFYLSLEDDLMRLFGSDRISRVMNRLGLPEDQPIEHSMITKSIETAQRQVESQNFEIRKHVLEYDDVMNLQREFIYDQRMKCLSGDGLHEQVMDLIKDTVSGLIENFTQKNTYPENWQLDELFAYASQLFPLPWGKRDLDLNTLTQDELYERLLSSAQEAYRKREEQLGAEVIRELERMIMLQVIDSKWRDHLAEMDYLQEGIGLRAIGQKDPLIEYKNEAYQLFQDMIQSIKEDFVKYIFHVRVVQEEVARPRLRAVSGGNEAAVARGPEPSPSKKVSKKVGRNDPCPCGATDPKTGKPIKYKKCCGR